MTKRIVYRNVDKTAINEVLLHQELTQTLGEKLVGIQINAAKTRIALLSPTEADLKTVDRVLAAHDPQKRTSAQDTYYKLENLLKDTVGKPVTELATPDRWALLFALLYQNKALADDMTVRPFAAWVSPQDHDYD